MVDIGNPFMIENPCQKYYERLCNAGKISGANKKTNRYELLGDFLYIWSANTSSIFVFNARAMFLIPLGLWVEDKDGYLCTTIKGKRRPRKVYAHQLIKSGCPPGYETDHKDGRTYNNLDKNLQFVLHKNNIRKARLYKTNKSGFRGVHRNKPGNGRPWVAQITVDYKGIHLGSFDDSVCAAAAYDNAAIKYFGEYANTNAKMGLL